MHPAPSVIIFTTLSGLGFGLFVWLGLGIPAVRGLEAFMYFFAAYALTVGGLIASTFHLGNPRNAIYAFSQWRTSWLSREGLMSIITLLGFAPYAIGLIFFGTSVPVLGYLAAALALFTVFTTSMIYTQLKTVPRWNMPLNPALFLLYAVSGGALVAGQGKVAGLLIFVITVLQIAAWMIGDRRLPGLGSNKGTATGLGTIGPVRLLDSAHTARNYILDEMVHIIGRKHSRKLRVLTVLFLGAFPVVLLLVTSAGPGVIFLALGSHAIGVLAARWLFFAEAEHVVGLYYTRG